MHAWHNFQDQKVHEILRNSGRLLEYNLSWKRLQDIYIELKTNDIAVNPKQSNRMNNNIINNKSSVKRSRIYKLYIFLTTDPPLIFLRLSPISK